MNIAGFGNLFACYRFNLVTLPPVYPGLANLPWFSPLAKSSLRSSPWAQPGLPGEGGTGAGAGDSLCYTPVALVVVERGDSLRFPGSARGGRA